MMESGSLSDKSGLYNFTRPDGTTLFDFQIDAVKHCVRRLSQGKTAVLGLDTGLGKTCTVRSIIDSMNVRALVIVPGGLVRQVAQGLRRQPWQNSNTKVVIIAETGKQLQAEHPSHDILVVNRALGIWRRRDYDIVIIDEAHQSQSVRTAGTYKGGNTPVLFMTACPSEAPELVEWFRPYGGRRHTMEHSRAFAESCFVVEKTPRVLTLLGVAKPRMVEVPSTVPLNLQVYGNSLLHHLEYRGNVGSILKVRVALFVAKFLPQVAEKAARIVRHEIESAAARDSPVQIPPGDLLQRCKELCESQSLSWPVMPPPPTEQKEQLNDAYLRCSCCGLTDSECTLLHSMHVSAVSSSSQPPPWAQNSSSNGGTFTSALVRFADKRSIDFALAEFPVPDNVLVFVLTADKSAAYRANLIKKFASHDGHKAKLNVLARAIRRGTAPQGLLRAGAIGMGRYLLTKIEQFLAKSRFLIADATVDVGFDLHRHVNGIFVNNTVRTYTELRQLVGRVCRIAVDREDQGVIDVLTRTYPGTLDKLFVKHLDMAATEAELESKTQREALSSSNNLSSSDVAQRARQLLAGDSEVLKLFEQLLASVFSHQHILP